MEDYDATAGNVAVPPFLLAVLHDVILVLKPIIADEVSPWFVTQSRYIGKRCLFFQFGGCEPPHYNCQNP